MIQSSSTAGFDDAGLLLVGHGSTVNADSAGPTLRQAERMRQMGIFGEVGVCFWKEQPVISAALRGFFRSRVFVVPLFISEGYFTEEVIPRELGLIRRAVSDWSGIQRSNERTVYYCGPVGTHPSMAMVILARAQSVMTEHPGSGPTPGPCQCSLFVAGHGTGNNENSRKAIEAQVERIAGLGIYHDVHALFMEEEPRIEAADALAGTDNIVVVPFFIADGLHGQEDIPVMLGAVPTEVQAQLRRGEPAWRNPTLRRGKRVWYGRSIGDEPVLAEVILARVREAAAS